MQLPSDSCPMEPMAIIYIFYINSRNTILTVNSLIRNVSAPITRRRYRNSSKTHTGSSKLFVLGWGPTYNALVSMLQNQSISPLSLRGIKTDILLILLQTLLKYQPIAMKYWNDRSCKNIINYIFNQYFNCVH